MPVVSEDDVSTVVDVRRGHLDKILQPREPEEILSTAEVKNKYDKTNSGTKIEKSIKFAIQWLIEKQFAFRQIQIRKFLRFVLFSMVLFSKIIGTLAYPGTLHKWPQIGETTNDLYKGGGRNISSILFYKQEEMARQNLKEIATNFHECNYGGFYFLGQKNMYKEHLTDNEIYRQPEQLCGVVDLDMIRYLEDHDCIDKLKFVCKLNVKSFCPGDILFNDAAYRLFHEKLTWFQARDYCVQIDGILATPNHVNETDALVKIFIDHFQDNVQKRLWIGLTRLDYCIDGIPALGIPWMEGEPIYQYPCVKLVRAVIGEVQAKAVNCSTESFSTDEPPLTSHTVEQTVTSSTDAPPTQSPGTGMISLIAVMGVIILIITCVVTLFLALKLLIADFAYKLLA